MLVVPYCHDQPDHAARLTRMGVARALPRERYNSKAAIREIDALLSDPGYFQRASTLANRVGSENGAATACGLLRGLLAPPKRELLTAATGLEAGLTRS
jgi:UDP:flavonoid glycosyltransferase YjiC (YdhE family)